jgi:spore coat protein U-like protein
MQLIKYYSLINLRCLFLIIVYSANVQAQDCNLHLENLVNVEIKTSTSASSSKNITVQNKHNESFKVVNTGDACSFFVSFSGSSNIRYLKSERGKVAYGLYDSIQKTNSLIEIPIATERNLLTGEFKKQEKTKSFSYFYLMEVNDTISSGLYSDSVQVELYEGTPSNHTLHDTKTITFTTNIDPFINVTVQGGQGAGRKTTLNFGTAKPGISLGFNININANTGYDMLLESENRGVMRLDTHRLPNTIPYILSKDGRRLDISNIVKLPYTDYSHSRALERHDFMVSIGEFEYVLSGDYEDTITVTVMAR